MRTPQTIAAEAKKQYTDAAENCVSVNIVTAGELAVEFMAATVAALDAAGILPQETAAPAAPAA